MSAPIALVLGAESVRVETKGGSRPGFDVPWSPTAPEAMFRAVVERAGASSAVVIVVGLAFLDIAEPDLPPLSADDKRALLWRDADRYFPVVEPVALSTIGNVAMATPARLVEQWVQTATILGPVRAIIAVPQLCHRLVKSGTVAVEAGPDETGLVVVNAGTVVSVRRVMTRNDADVRGGRYEKAERLLDATALAQEALLFVDAPLDLQLLDQSLWSRMLRARHRRVLASVALALVSAGVLLWSADRWRERTLTATEARAAQLETQVLPAQQADRRLQSARAELRMLDDAAARQVAPESPLVVLGHLTRVLPRDAFVQKLEFDGQQWKVEGTSSNAPGLIPLLDAVADFRDVRTAAPGQRFLDAGRQRESFVISFRVVEAGGARGQR